MTIRSRNTRRSLRCETLEGRKLMAADLVVLDAVEFESVEIAPQPGSSSSFENMAGWAGHYPGVAQVSHFDGPQFDDIRDVLNGPGWDKGLTGQVAAGTYDWETVYGF